MTHTPLISVVMPVYNRISFIAESVDSILKQTLSDFEFIIIDDHSTDGTYEYLQTLSDPRIRLVRNEKNQGVSQTMNNGIALSKGEFVARMDSDDICLPSRFKSQVEFLKSHPEIVCCGTNFQIIGTEETVLMPTDPDLIAMALLDNSQLANPSAMFRKSVFDDTTLRYNAAYEPVEDYKLWTQLVKNGKLGNIPAVHFKYRIHGSQVSNSKEIQKKAIDRIKREYTTELSNNHSDAELFSYLPVRSYSDLKAYRAVEKLVIEELQKRGVKTNKAYFSNRIKRRLRKSIFDNPGSPWMQKIELLVMSGTFLGWRAYFKLFLQSLRIHKS